TKVEKTLNHTTKVYFKILSDEEINYYVDTFKLYDKAGAYGIQEWIGQIGIEKIEGSFFNVVGLPVYEVYRTLEELVNLSKPYKSSRRYSLLPLPNTAFTSLLLTCSQSKLNKDISRSRSTSLKP